MNTLGRRSLADVPFLLLLLTAGACADPTGSGGFVEDPAIYEKIERPEELLAALDKEGYPACSRLLATALAAAGDASAGVTMRGIDVERDAKVSRVFEKIAKGK